MNTLSSTYSPLARHAHWLLRIALVSVFLYHGSLKFMNLGGFAEMLSLSLTQTFFVALAQVSGSVLIVLGGLGRSVLFDIATRLGAALNIPVMIGAIVLVHWGRWNFVPTESHPLGGMEFQAVLALIMMYLVSVGNQFTGTTGHVCRRENQEREYDFNGAIV
ncbi:putative oxidoreductase [Alteromonadaceae bacterium Bs31]|nr:putative oxidoreductase [Alteromonadaceae bacterium Bs31]